VSSQIKISSIIIAKDEENNITRCIESQLKCIDEIIVLVDNESQDKTFEIVKSYDLVIVEKVNWLGFGKTKQYGVDKANNEWILWIDADEALTPGLQDEILKFKSGNPNYFVYKIARRAFFLGKWIKHSGWYPDYVSRLFNRKYARFNSSKVHETLVYNCEAGKLNNDLEHYTDPSIEHYFNKFNRYTTLAAEQLYNDGFNVNLADLIIRPFFIFIKMFIIKLGFLDGLHGLILAAFSAGYVFTKYAKVFEYKFNKSNKK